MWRAGETATPRRQYVPSVYLNVCVNKLDSVCLNGWAGQGKPPGGSLKYQFGYLKIRIFKCSYRSYKKEHLPRARLDLAVSKDQVKLGRGRAGSSRF